MALPDLLELQLRESLEREAATARERSGERRSADINALVGESLNLAYHGARAEKAGFTITLKQDFDPKRVRSNCIRRRSPARS